MQEVEYKCIITEEIYNKVKEHFQWDWSKHQINNYYFDEAGELAKRHIMVRVREKDNSCAVQVKAHKNPGNALQICEETEFPIDHVPEKISAEDSKRYTGIATGELIRIGSLDTLRNSLMWNSSVEICLDKSEYLDKCDYEIEVEYTGDFPDELTDELKKLGIEFRDKSVGKYTRFITRLMQIIHEK